MQNRNAINIFFQDCMRQITQIAEFFSTFSITIHKVVRPKRQTCKQVGVYSSHPQSYNFNVFVNKTMELPLDYVLTIRFALVCII